MKRKTKYIIIIILLAAIIGGGLGLYLFFKPIKNFAESEAELTLTSKELFESFVKDQNKANLEFVSEDKIIQIKGKILEINFNPDKTSTILIEVGNPEGDISCSIISNDFNKARKCKVGESIKIQGQCTGYQELINKEVIMIRCGIVE